MSITRERFEEGLTYEAYREQMTRNRERFEANEQTVELNGDDVDFFTRLPRPLNVLVLAEDWCGDVIANLPVLGRLAAASGKLNVRVFARDQHPDIMDQYLYDGQFRSIPVFVFFDSDFRELGHWIERPAAVRAATDRFRADLFANDPVLRDFPKDTSPAQLPEEARLRYSQAFSAFREEIRSFSDREVVREIRAIVEAGLMFTSTADRRPSVEGMAPPPSVSQQARRLPKVRITYCAECGYEPQTLALASALMQTFITDLSSIELIPWHGGAFDVTVDDELVHSMYRDGGFPDSETVIRAVRGRLKS